MDFNAVPDGKTKCTKAIQDAIDACSSTGGKVIVPTGVFLSGSLRLKSDVNLHLEHGAVLLSSLDEEDMIDFSKDFEDDNEDTGWEGGCFLYACHEKNIAITGTGKIDGQGRNAFFDDEPDGSEHECPLNVRGFRPRMSFLEDVENLTVSDVTFYDSAFWTLHMAGCRNVRIENIVIDNNKRGPNNDGIDPDCCQNVIIRGCRIITGDDSIVLKSTAPMYKKYGECKDIIVSSCFLSSNCSAIKIGTETYGDIHDIIVADCIIKDSIRGIGIWSRDGGEIYNIRIHHIMGNTRNFSDSSVRREGIYSWWGEGEPLFITATKREGVDRIPGAVHDIYIDHVNLCSEAPIILVGEDYSPIDRVHVTDSEIVFKRQSSKKNMIMDERPSERGRYPLEMSCSYLRSAHNIDISSKFIIDDSMKDLIS